MPSPRPRVALLTLQLRELLDAVAIAEAQVVDWDLETARARLRTRLDSFVEERRRVLDETLSQAQADAAEAIAAAHAHAAAHAAAHAEASSIALPGTLAHLPLTFADEGGRIESYRGAPAPITVNVDTDALAAAIAAVLDARDVATRSVESSATTRRVPVPVRKSFWSGALHADVLMALVAMVIVLVVLVAWSS